MRIILEDKKGKSKMNDRVMNTYVYTTRDIVEALKKNGITKSTIQISQHIRDNNFEGRRLAIKIKSQIKGCTEPVEIWKISFVGSNLILQYFLTQQEEQKKIKESGVTIKEIVNLYGKDYKYCNESSISVFMKQEKFVERKLAVKTSALGKTQKWVIKREGVEEMFLKLFKKKESDEQISILPNGENKFIYTTTDIENYYKNNYYIGARTLLDALNILEKKGMAKKVPKRNGIFEPNKPSRFMWVISKEGFEEIKKYLNVRYITKTQQSIIKKVQDRQNPTTHNENSYEIVLDDNYSEYLHIISKTLNKKEIEVIRNVVEKFIDSKKEDIANILKI